MSVKLLDNVLVIFCQYIIHFFFFLQISFTVYADCINIKHKPFCMTCKNFVFEWMNE